VLLVRKGQGIIVEEIEDKCWGLQKNQQLKIITRQNISTFQRLGNAKYEQGA